jgi:hypothetical protein
MRGRASLAIAFLAVLWVLSCPYPPAFAEVAVGTVIDKTNAELAEGLIPDAVLNWIKKGDGTMTVGEVPYDLSDYLPPPAKQYMESNKGKYDVGPDGLLVDVKTGKLPEFIDGMPFPEIDLKDPHAGEKIMYNKHYYSYAVGPIDVPFQTKWVGRNTGMEREIIMDYWTYLLDGYPPAREEPNPEQVEMHSLIIALAPYDIKGTNILLWRYRNDRLDSTFAYVPAIRRVRRMSPANRSDSFLGSDFCVDDAWGYGGKINTFNWKLIEKKDQLIPIYPGPPVKLVKNDVGEWVSVSEGRHIDYGFQTEGWQGAPWWPTDGIIYINRPTYILECSAKDKYYNYGPQQMWVDAGVYTPTYKVISDRSGAYWKVEWQALGVLQNEDKSFQTSGLSNMMAFDDRSQHACVLILYSPENSTRYLAQHDRNDFSLGGFQKLCK